MEQETDLSAWGLWTPVEGEERDWILNHLGYCRGAEKLGGAAAQVRKRELSFYAHLDLYEIASPDGEGRPSDEGPGRVHAFAIGGMSGLWPLTGSSSVIHRINKIARDGKMFDLSGPKVLDYLRFFCEFVTGPEGPFFVVDRPGVPGAPEPEDLPDPEAWEEFAARLTPLEITARDYPADGRDETVTCRSTVRYGNKLHAAQFVVRGDGMVEMVDYEEIAELPPSHDTWWDAQRADVIEPRWFDARLAVFAAGAGWESRSAPGEVVSADEFQRRLAGQGRHAVFTDVVIRGPISVPAATLPSDTVLEFRDCRIEGGLQVRGALGSLVMERVVLVDGALDLTGAEFADDVSLTFVTAASEKEPPSMELDKWRERFMVNLNRVSIRGELGLRRVAKHPGFPLVVTAEQATLGSLVIEGCTVGQLHFEALSVGSVTVSDSILLSERGGAGLSLGRATCQRNLDLADLYWAALDKGNRGLAVDLLGVEVQGRFGIRDVAGQIRMQNAKVVRDVFVRRLGDAAHKPSGPLLDLSFGDFGRLDVLDCQGAINASGAQMRGWVILDNVAAPSGTAADFSFCRCPYLEIKNGRGDVTLWEAQVEHVFRVEGGECTALSAQRLRAGEVEIYEGEFGSIDLTGTNVLGPVSIWSVVVRNKLDLTAAQMDGMRLCSSSIGSVDLKQASSRRGISLAPWYGLDHQRAGVRIESDLLMTGLTGGPFSLSGSSVGGRVELDRAHLQAVELYPGPKEVGGELHLEPTTIQGGLSARQCVVEHDVQIVGCRIDLEGDRVRGGEGRAALHGSAMRIGGDLKTVLAPRDLQELVLKRFLPSEHPGEEEGVAETRRKVGKLTQGETWRTEIHGDADLSAAEIRGSIGLGALEVGGSLSLADATIMGGVSMWSVEVRNTLDLSASSINGVRLWSSSIGCVDLTQASSRHGVVLAQWRLLDQDSSGVRIETDLLLTGVKGGPFVLAGCSVGGRVEMDRAQLESVEMYPAPTEVHGEVRLERTAIQGGLSARQCVVEHDVRIAGCRIGPEGGGAHGGEGRAAFSGSALRVGGDLRTVLAARDLEELVLKPFLPSEHPGEGEDMAEMRRRVGRLTQENGWRTEMEGAVDLSAAEIDGTLVLGSLDVGGSLSLADATVRGGVSSEGGTTVGGDLDLTSLETGEDVDLTKIQLVGGGSLKAARLIARGTVYLSDRGTGTAPSSRMCVGGNVDLGAATLGGLVLARDCLPEKGISREQPEGIAPPRLDLADAKIETLTVWENPPEHPVSLKGLTVQRWEFLPRGEKDTADELRDFLGKDPQIQRALYRSIEQQLYDQGEEEASDRIFQAMWAREAATQRGRDRLWFSAWAKLEFGTRVPAWLLFLLIGWPVVSVLWFSVPSSVMVTRDMNGREVTMHRGHVIPEGNSPRSWNFVDGTWVALRYHIPLVPLEARADFVPNDDWPSQAFSSEDYASLVWLLHWLLIPYVLVFLTKNLLRRAKRGT